MNLVLNEDYYDLVVIAISLVTSRNCIIPMCQKKHQEKQKKTIIQVNFVSEPSESQIL
jgi:hypothetical protein